MFGLPFSHNIIRKTTVGFGTIFNNIYVVRKVDSEDVNSAEQERIKIPLSYGPAQKFLARLNSQTRNEELENSVEIVLPRIAFEMTGLVYDASRKTTTITKKVEYGTTISTCQSRFNKIPYIVDFNVHIMTKNNDDALQIIEQILPFFTPEYSLSLNLTDIDETVDVDIELENCTVDDSWSGAMTERRVIVWNLTFKAKIYLYGPISTSGLITSVETNIFDYDTGIRYEKITVTAPAGATPGTANLDSLTGFNTTITTYESGLTTSLTGPTGGDS